MVSLLAACAFGLWLGTAGAADGETSGQLDQALKSVEELQYDQARGLLLQAIESGKLQAADLVKAYFNLGIVESGLDNGVEATDAFYLALMLEPTVALPKGSSPKIREYLNEARKRVMQVGVLQVRLTLVRGAVGVAIDNDPLSLVKQVKVTFTKGEGGTSEASLDPKGKMRIEVGSDASDVQAALLDDNGNQLKVLKPAEAGGDKSKPEPAADANERSWVAHWGLWAGVSVFFGATGTYLMLKSGQTEDALTRARAQGDAGAIQELQDDKDRFSLGGLVTLSVAGAAAVAAGTVIVLTSGDKEAAQATLVPSVAPGHLGAELNLRF
jgi:hypothetical protein